MIEDYISTKEAAQIAKVTTGRIRQLLAKGELRGKRIGRDWIVERHSVKEFASLQRKPGPKPLDKS